MEQFRFELKTKEDDLRPVYLTGNFNNWDPLDEQFEMKKIHDDTFEFLIDQSQLQDTIEYKFTRGGWQNVELDKHGNITENRVVAKSAMKVSDEVAMWRINWGPYKDEFMPKVELISDNFEIPQLNKTRRVWALLPHNYNETDIHYPVLYLQDAQNLFNESSPYGNWEIDKKMSILAEYGRGDLIIVAVEHGNEDRLKEYIFENNPLVEQGDGKKYIRFVTDTLKPYIDKNYRTLPDREHTGIGGSSLGGLISIYGGFLYPEVYSKLMIFSPSLWAVPKISFPNIQFYNPFQTKIYIYGGDKEGAQMTERIHQFVEAMEAEDDKITSDLEFKVSVNPKGEHNEFCWSQEFPRAMEWLYFDSYKDPTQVIKENKHD